MRRDKTAARIILILSVVHVAIAAPAIVRQSSLHVDEDVTSTSEKRGSSVDDTSQDLYPVPQMDNELPTTSGTPQDDDDPPPKSGTLQLRNDRPQTSGPPPSQDDTLPASEDPRFHNDPAGSEYPQLHDAPSPWLQHSDSGPTRETVQGESSAQLEASVHVHDDMSESGKSVHELEPPTDFPAGEGTPYWRSLSWMSESPPSWLKEDPAPSSEADGVFSEKIKQTSKILAGIGAVAAVSTGLAYGVHKLIKDHSHGAQPAATAAGRDLKSSDVVGRGVNKHPTPSSVRFRWSKFTV